MKQIYSRFKALPTIEQVVMCILLSPAVAVVLLVAVATAYFWFPLLLAIAAGKAFTDAYRRWAGLPKMESW